MTAPRRWIAFGSLVWTLGCGGGSSRSPEPPAPASAAQAAVESASPRDVLLPNLSEMRPTVQAQLRARFEAASALAARADAAPAAVADAYGELGVLLLAAQCFDAAETSFKVARAGASSDPRWPYYLGHVARQQGATDRAVALLEAANRLKPNDTATLVWLGHLHLQRGEPAAAEPYFTAAAAATPRLAAARFGLGRVALARQDYGTAVGEFEQALALDPGAAGVHYPLALAYRGAGNQEKAELHAALRRDADVRPPDPLLDRVEEILESPAAYERRGMRALEARDWTTAAEAFRKGLAIEPANPSLHQRLSTALYLTGDRVGARRELERSLEADSGFARAHFSLALLDDEEGRQPAALQHLAAAVRRDPAYVEARLRLASLLRRLGRSREATAQYQEVLRLDPRVVEGRVALAMLLADAGQYREARDTMLESLTKIDSGQPAFAQLLARILATAPDPQVRDGERALKLAGALVADQQTPDRAETMAMACASLGRLTEAVDWQEKAVDGAIRGGRPDIAARMGESLARYTAGQTVQRPWRDDERP